MATGVIFAPIVNKPFRRDADEFKRQAEAFVRTHRMGDSLFMIDNGKSREDIIDMVCAEFIGLRDISVVAIFAHGWSSGIQLGFRLDNIERLAGAIGIAGAPNVTVILYACSTGLGVRRDAAGTGDNSFADVLRDELCKRGRTQCRVVAHTTAGHCVRNPHARFFEGLGSGSGGSGGSWVVRPGSTNWPVWKRRLRETDLGLRFPLMSHLEIGAELSAG